MSTKTASEIFVDNFGVAHDDEGNSWFVGRQHAGTYPGTGWLPFPLSEVDDDRSGSRYRPRPVNQNQLKALQELSAKKPGDFVKSLTSQVANGYPLSRKQLDILIKMFVTARMVEEIRHFDTVAYTKLKAPVQQPRGNNPHLDALDALLRRKQDSFVQSIRDQVAAGRRLTENQTRAVRAILHRNSMRAEADLFREASATKVASLYIQSRRMK